MREIIFRAKRIDNREWIEGDLIHYGKQLLIAPNNVTWLDFIGRKLPKAKFEVDPETVCQFTGLTDNNGVKIFENDLMGGGHLGFTAAVTFNDGMFQLVTSAHQGNSPLVQDRASRLKVLGNIFDNPELLTQ